ncbi:uncharacterized protein BP01DRAFT_343957 [Aspergillus saccharolyticus JOP 1030-1]|uniref:F-box domain-containing protein n=1 Tax=Aspergillus saccharolyticus JOP 1030-1 TaxID=1450539 RepID=A0A318ZGS7_9EURO|nr:hypothetical protein BP01DRAFT_343957 [Aspergillus saccharolyticus JOP 1030-1]PYH43783.1 hypothetical protein BP01DRAFT_343957 [Aspergillus saccharolyticus JOP 1030-1]
MATVNQNMFEASVTTDRPQGAPLLVLPLNLIALIISSLDDPGDLARLCRTCRVLNYMTLPQLYKNITLTSYDKIRYRDDQPEGMGSASPFSMGLNAVITRPYANLVRSLTLRGNWRESELEEHARVGRVPDSSMMLNIAVRAAVDKMPDLESFSWELNTKMMETVYLGLAQLPKLTSLTLRFPSSRHPRPTIVIPAIPHLRYLKITDIDPLCYPDDISTLLFRCRKLRELKMHWSPRMRIEQEPSVMLHDYFRKCIAAKRPLSVRKIGLQNLYALHTEEFKLAFAQHPMEEVTILNDIGSDAALNTFVDNTWPTIPHAEIHIKCIRQDALSRRQADFLSHFTGLEKLYFVNASSNSRHDINSPRQPVAAPALTPPQSDTNGSVAYSSAANTPINSPSLQANIRDCYLNNIISNHASTLRHLLLPARWPLSANTVARLVHASPQLEQLGFATEFSTMDTLGLLLPFLRQLTALRILVPTGSTSDQSRGSQTTSTKLLTDQSSKPPPSLPTNPVAGARSFQALVEADDDILIEKLSAALADQQIFHRLKVLGLGRKAFSLGDHYTIPTERPNNHPVEPQTPTASRAQSAEAGRSPSQHQHFNSAFAADKELSNGNHHHHKMYNGSIIPAHPTSGNQPPTSSLGKRPRPDDEETPPARPVETINTPIDEEEDLCTPRVFWDPRGREWRRQVRRVGWEVLQHWEIWALDKQEL